MLQSSPTYMSGMVGALQNCAMQVGCSTLMSIYALVQSSVDSTQAEGTRSYQGIAWAGRYIAIYNFVLMIGFLVFYHRTDQAERTEMAEEVISEEKMVGGEPVTIAV